MWFYLRGEEYSAQIDYFVKSIEQRRLDGENSFQSALQADRVVAMILERAVVVPALGPVLPCLLYTSDAADERSSVDLGGRRIIQKQTTPNGAVSTVDKQ